jgi:hypothetical protein
MNPRYPEVRTRGWIYGRQATLILKWEQKCAGGNTVAQFYIEEQYKSVLQCVRELQSVCCPAFGCGRGVGFMGGYSPYDIKLDEKYPHRE